MFCGRLYNRMNIKAHYNDCLFYVGVSTNHKHNKIHLAIIGECDKRRKSELAQTSLKGRLSA